MALEDMFLLIEGQKTGKINGESNDAVYPGQIQIAGWSWGMSSSSSMGGMGASSKASLSELSISKIGISQKSLTLFSPFIMIWYLKSLLYSVNFCDNN